MGVRQARLCRNLRAGAIVFVFLSAFAARTARGAITHDASSSVQGNSTEHTWTHTVGAGTDRILVVGVSISRAIHPTLWRARASIRTRPPSC